MSDPVTFQRKAFDRALRGFERETGLGAHDVLKDAMVSLLRGAVRAMPPKTAKRGKDAIRVDLLKVLGATSRKASLVRLNERFGKRFYPLHFDPDGGAAADFHVEKFRNNRGRIPASLKPKTVKFGPYTRQAKRYVPKREFNRIYRAKIARVGRAKAGFRMAAKKFGLRLPGWIERHGTAPGYGRDTYQPDKPYFYLEAVNAVPHAQRHRGLVERQLDNSTYMLRSKLDNILKQTAKKHSAK